MFLYGELLVMKKGSQKRDQGMKTDIEGRQGSETSEGCEGELPKLMGFIQRRCDVGGPSVLVNE